MVNVCLPLLTFTNHVSKVKNFYTHFNIYRLNLKFGQIGCRFFASTIMSGDSHHLLSLNSINPNVINMEYAVRGPLVIRATALEKEIKKGVSKPFDRVIKANIGDCHAMGQQPITYIRQVLSCIIDPQLLETSLFPPDVKAKAKQLLDSFGGHSAGSYSDSAGVEIIRRHCAEYIAKRDNVPSDWQDIVLTTGASEAVRAILTLINSGSQDGLPTGVMIPIPQYPLYTATLAEYAMFPIEYYLGNKCHTHS